MKKRLDIIVIDDDPRVRDSLKQTLEGSSHTVRVAADGDVGLTQVDERVPDLVITDIIMPNREGIETIQDLRHRYPNLKIIGISGGGRAGKLDFLELAQQFGADAVLAKPFSAQKLMEAIERLKFDDSDGESAKP